MLDNRDSGSNVVVKTGCQQTDNRLGNGRAMTLSTSPASHSCRWSGFQKDGEIWHTTAATSPQLRDIPLVLPSFHHFPQTTEQCPLTKPRSNNQAPRGLKISGFIGPDCHKINSDKARVRKARSVFYYYIYNDYGLRNQKNKLDNMMILSRTVVE